MDADISPEPTPEEREALLAALAGPDGDEPPSASTSAWRAAGLAFDD